METLQKDLKIIRLPQENTYDYNLQCQGETINTRNADREFLYGVVTNNPLRIIGLVNHANDLLAHDLEDRNTFILKIETL
jgi:hypothetical protein